MTTDNNNTISIDFNPFEEEREIEKIVAINESQREIWLSCMIGGEPATLAYNESVSLKLSGTFSFPDFKQALTSVVQRHETLRSTVSANGEHFIVYKSIDFEFEFTDLQNLPTAEASETFDQFLKNQMLSPIDLQDGPLFRVYVHRFTPTEHRFTLVIHHIICDGWSTGIILENLSATYNAVKKGLLPSLPPIIQISDYAKQQFDFLQSDEFKETSKFWQDIYKDQVPLVDLPTDFERGKSRSYKAARKDYKLNADLVNKLKTTGGKAGCSLVNTMLSLFEIFLAQQTKQKDIVVGLPAAGQLATNMQELVGHCVNILPIRSKIDSSLSFLDYLKKSKSIFLDAYEHQLFSFGQLLKNLNFKRDPSRVPLVPIVFNIDMGMSSAVSFDGLHYEISSVPRAFETFEIFLNATGTEDALLLEWTYNSQLFKEATIERMIGDFEYLLNSFVVNPQQRIDESNLQRNITLNLKLPIQTDNLYSGDNVVNLICDTAKIYQNKVAIRFFDNTITYFELHQQSNRFAQLLTENGIHKGDVVGLYVSRSIEMIVVLVGILKAGATYLPLDPIYPKGRIEYMLNDSNAKLLVISEKYSDTFKPITNTLELEEAWKDLANYDGIFESNISLNQVSNIIYTSGTTGNPKGTCTTHKNLANLMCSIRSKPGITDKDIVLAITTVSFDIAATELILPLITGAEIVIATEEQGKDGRELIDLIKNYNITILQATPSRWKMILESGWEEKYELTVFTAGEALDKKLATDLLAKSKAVWNLYGPTETTIYSTVKEVTAQDNIITIGKPINNTNVYILDDHKNILPVNAIGELFIGGEGVADGYLNRNDLTDEKFVSDPFNDNPNAKMYQTGDLGRYLDNGEIQCLGRIDHQIKIRGFRIEVEEIEVAIASLAGIKKVVVATNEVRLGDKKLIAYVKVNELEQTIIFNLPIGVEVIGDGRVIAKETISVWKEKLKDHLPIYMIPDYFIAVNEFPLTPNGKIDRKALPTLHFPLNADKATPPLTPDEKIVAEIWSEILGINDLKATDDFFELGGHSLLAIKVMVEIEKKTGKRLPLTILFNHSSLEGFALQFPVKNHSNFKALVPIKTTGSKPPLFLIHGAGLNILLFKSITRHLDNEQPIYGIQALGLNGDTEIPEDIAGIASAYIKEMLVVNPTFPFAILGYSMGGVIAFEIAKQLKEMGKSISLLGMMDTYVGMDTLRKENFYNRGFRKLYRQLKKIPFVINSFINYPLATIHYQSRFVKNRIKQIAGHKLESEKNVLSKHEQLIYDKYNDAYENYTFNKLDVTVLLFRVSKRLYYLDDLVYLGWDKVSTKVEIKTVPGDHRTFLFEPNDKEFALILEKALAEKQHKVNDISTNDDD